jgi:hypothetical protein
VYFYDNSVNTLGDFKSYLALKVKKDSSYIEIGGQHKHSKFGIISVVAITRNLTGRPSILACDKTATIVRLPPTQLGPQLGMSSVKQKVINRGHLKKYLDENPSLETPMKVNNSNKTPSKRLFDEGDNQPAKSIDDFERDKKIDLLSKELVKISDLLQQQIEAQAVAKREIPTQQDDMTAMVERTVDKLIQSGKLMRPAQVPSVSQYHSRSHSPPEQTRHHFYVHSRYHSRSPVRHRSTSGCSHSRHRSPSRSYSDSSPERYHRSKKYRR